jgi:hypothetical protein
MERVWSSRLRWRLRGAWLWPAFAALTVLDAVFIRLRPVSGLATGLVPALLLAGFLNLGAVAVLAPVAARLLRRRRRDLPRIVALDYAGTSLLVLVLAGLVTAGLVHHGEVVRERRTTAYATLLATDYVQRHGPPPYRRGIGAADTYRIEPGRLYRTCVPGPAAGRPLCLMVHLDTSPPQLIFGGHEPNASWAPHSVY